MTVISDYLPLWEKLKADKKVSVTANRLLHKRIVKAVKKRKNLDIGYKLQIEPRRAVLSHVRSNSIITFFLTLSITAEDI